MSDTFFDAFNDTGKYRTSSRYMIVKFYSNQMRWNVFKYGRDSKLNGKLGKKILSHITEISD